MKNIFTRTYQKSPGRKNAQGMLEFALVLPVLLLMILGIIEFSRLMFAWIIIENSTRFGIRYATTGNFDQPILCRHRTTTTTWPTTASLKLTTATPPPEPVKARMRQMK